MCGKRVLNKYLHEPVPVGTGLKNGEILIMERTGPRCYQLRLDDDLMVIRFLLISAQNRKTENMPYRPLYKDNDTHQTILDACKDLLMIFWDCQQD